MATIRRTQFKKSDVTRARILDSAAYVLSTRGYARMRISDVADHAEMNGPSAYYHFDSRDALVAEVMSEGVRGMRVNLERVLAELPADTPALEKVLIAAEQHLRYCLLMSHYPRASIRNGGQLGEELRVDQRAEERAYGVVWRDLLDVAAATGEVDPEVDLPMARRLILGGLSWTVEWWDFERGDVDRLVAAARALVRGALTR